MTKFEFQPFDKVLVRNDNVDVWTPAFFGRLDTYEKGKRYCHVTTGSTRWAQCIPYNETTKHLCGTSDSYIGPVEFEIGDTVRFQYTECTTGCGEIVGASGDTFQVSVFGGVYSVDRKRLNLVRKGEKKTDTPDEAPPFEFGDVVGVCSAEFVGRGIFLYPVWEDKNRVCVVDQNGVKYNCREKQVILIRKGNFND